MSHYSAIEISNLDYKYPDGTQALHGVSLKVAENETVGLLGHNGAGKSTLILHLNGIIIGGDVRVFGTPVTKKSIRQVRQRVGLIFQNPDDQLFCPTVFDDIAFGARQLGLSEKEVIERVRHSVSEVGLDESILKKNVFHLSFGQKKLVSIATVTAMDARVLVFDEPTAGLDPRARKKIINLLRSLGRTQIIASHDLDMLSQLCDRVVLLSGGAVAAEGKTSDILNDIPLLEKSGVL